MFERLPLLNRIKSEILFRYLYNKNKNNACLESLNHTWSDINYNRISLINYAIAMRGGESASYLEIGCFGNHCFDSIMSINKTGVDPRSGGTVKTTSDEFFSNNDKIFDVIFIDGLHTFEQCRRDTINALKFCKTGGFVILHDFIPRNWREEHTPRLQLIWTGDVWKTSFELQDTSGVDFKLAEVDHGVAVVKKLEDDVKYCDKYNELRHWRFKEFHEHYKSLPTTDAAGIFRFIRNERDQ